MAFNKSNSAKATNNKQYLNIAGATVQAAYQISDSVISFTLNIPGASLRNMKLVSKKDGGTFISAPQVKGKDGNYHDVFCVWLSEADEARISKLVQDVFVGQDEKRDFTTRYEVK